MFYSASLKEGHCWLDENYKLFIILIWCINRRLKLSHFSISVRNPCWDHECPKHSHCERTPYSNKSIVAKCICDRGFEWVEKDQECQDINECEHPGTCSQICVNTRGGYKCECRPGYIIERHFFCRADGEPSWLYYANRRDIRRLRADSRYSEILVEETENSIALDFDYDEGLMFWTDVGLEQIMR